MLISKLCQLANKSSIPWLFIDFAGYKLNDKFNSSVEYSTGKSMLQNSAVSHTSKSKKTHIDAYWIAPRDAPETVQFL